MLASVGDMARLQAPIWRACCRLAARQPSCALRLSITAATCLRLPCCLHLMQSGATCHTSCGMMCPVGMREWRTHTSTPLPSRSTLRPLCTHSLSPIVPSLGMAYQGLRDGLVNLVVCLSEVLHHHCSAGHLLEGPVLLAQVLLPYGVVHGVVGRKVVGVGTTWVILGGGGRGGQAGSKGKVLVPSAEKKCFSAQHMWQPC